MAFSLVSTDVILARNAGALYGLALGNTNFTKYVEWMGTQPDDLLNFVYSNSVGATSTATVADVLIDSLGITGVEAIAVAKAYVISQLDAVEVADRGAVIDDILAVFSNLSSDAVYGPAATAWNNRVANAVFYGSQAGTPDSDFGASTGGTFTLTTGTDTIRGSSGDETFLAYIYDNDNSLQSADTLTGGAGNDTLRADIGDSQNFSITPHTTGIENAVFRVQANQFDSGDNNIRGIGIIDAQRMQGVTNWEDNNSRADLVIEDVRIADNQITKDITITMRETDPGDVDFGVYFDQNSLRNVSSSASQINLRVMDTYAVAQGLAELKDSPYGSFTFWYSLDGGEYQSLTLASDAIQDAQTFEDMVAAMQAAVDAQFGDDAVTVSLGSAYTVPDSVTGENVTGNEIVLSANGNIDFDTTRPGSGWLATDTVPAVSGLYTSFNTNSTSSSELVTSTIVLDDVGRGSMGGDLIVGGLSVGETSNSKGVQQFDITVEDSSKLQNISSTNNTLQVVNIVNGTANGIKAAYYDPREGNLTVTGNVGVNTDLVGWGNTPNERDGYGFNNVRIIDASAMTGKFEFDALFDRNAIAKYVDLVDTGALPATDNIDVVYSGGTNDDTMVVDLDTDAVSSRSNIVSGREDFTFTVNGNGGDDDITLTMISPTLAGGAQAWYTNQKLNANVTINSGDGDDTIYTPGAGDVIINAGSGNDAIYTDNTGALSFAVANGSATAAAVAYTNAAAAELDAALAAAVADNATGFVHNDGLAIGASITPAAQVALLATLDQLTPTNPPALPVITHAALEAGTLAAFNAGAISAAQKIALDAAYNAATGGTVTPGALGAPATIAGAVVTAGNVTAAELAAGDALLATYVAAANAAAAADAANAVNLATHAALLNATQAGVVAATLAVNGVDDPTTGANEAGTATIVQGLATLASAITVGATQAAVTAALDAATLNGSITAAQAIAINAAIGAYPVAAGGLAAATAILSPLQNTANLNNTAAQTALTNAIAADTAAVNVAANFAAGDPVLAGAEAVAADAVGSAETAAAAAAAAAASDAAAVDLAAAQAINTALAGLKSAVNVGSLAADVTNALDNAVAAINTAIADSAANGTGAVAVNPLLAPGVYGALVAAAGSPVTAATELAFDTGPLGVYDPNAVDSLIINNTQQVDVLALIAADAAAIAAATETAATIALAAANSGTTDLIVDAPTAVYVFNTSDQTAGYNRLTADDRNLADLKSDANDSYNFFNSTLTVNYKGIAADVVIAGTGYKTTDLEINQAIKHAINDDAVLSKLLVAEDGPANSLVITSLIDGTHTTADLAVSLTLPTTLGSSVSAAAAAYGLPANATEAQVLAVMTAAKVTFDANGDYTTQFAESGAAANNVVLTGIESVSSSDNTIAPGTGDDVIVLGTTVGTDLLTSSNEKVVYGADFGNDTIVHFDATGLGIDQLDFSALGGRGTATFNSLSADKSIVVGAPTGTPLTAVQVAALFTDSATAISHVYVEVDNHNIGSVYTVADAAGTAAGNVTATLVGTIDMADTAWASLTAANFV